MRFGIDVMFVRADGVVLRSERNLGRGHLRVCMKARWVCERPASPGLYWPDPGERVVMSFAGLQCKASHKTSETANEAV